MRGFTLIELMIAIVIIGILAAVAYPGYQNSIRRARRADAQGDLMAFAALMERAFTATNTYLGNGTPNTGTPPAGSGFPQTSPSSGGGQVAYNLTIQAATATTYTLAATPVAGPQAIDGVMTLNSAGQRTWDRNNSGVIDPGENTWNQ